MREEIASVVYDVLSYGLNLKRRLEAGEGPDLDLEQNALRGRLLSETQARGMVDFGGEGPERGSQRFLGIRYALVCWLDEMFILDSPWATQWDLKKLESSLYEGAADRAWKFWDQARKAEALPGTDVLEAFYLCVMLGFRGDYRHEPDRLQQWAATIQARIREVLDDKGPYVAERPDPPTNVPPLLGREQLRRVVFLLSGVLLGLLALVVVLVLIVVNRPSN